MSKDLPPSRTADQFVVRFPEGMRDRIAEAAKANNRSMNAEIVDRLSSSGGQDETVKLLRGNMVLLRALADFIVLRHNEPELMAPMESSIVNMAKAIKTAEGDEKFVQATREPFLEYVKGLTKALEQSTARFVHMKQEARRLLEEHRAKGGNSDGEGELLFWLDHDEPDRLLYEANRATRELGSAGRATDPDPADSPAPASSSRKAKAPAGDAEYEFLLLPDNGEPGQARNQPGPRSGSDQAHRKVVGEVGRTGQDAKSAPAKASTPAPDPKPNRLSRLVRAKKP